MDRHDAESFRQEFLVSINLYRRLLDRHVYPPFTNPERSAMLEADRLYQEWASEPIGEVEEGDMSEIAERATAKQQAIYDELFAMQTIVINLLAAGLFHLFEQQMGYLLRHDQLKPRWPFEDFPGWAEEMNIRVEAFPDWNRIDELRLVANVAKHAEGKSDVDLRKLRPELFDHPLLREPAYRDIPPGTLPTRTPLAGQDFYVSKADFEEYAECVVAFWRWFLPQVDGRRIDPEPKFP